ncbi:GNAT family N-acetyltransferase [Clostridiaceae bacterium 14S0207]|nr:GNAT family N-acetyltransferase [Clostridiaceae bacterium 14S0207]
MIVRKAEKDDVYDISKIHVDTWKSAYKNIIPNEYLGNRSYDKQVDKWNKRLFQNEDTKEFMLLAEDENGQVIGFSSASINEEGSEFDSTLYTLYVRQDYQKKGIGKLLVKEVASKLQSLGAESMILWTFAKNDASNFYKHIGGIKDKNKIVNIGGINMVEISYVWEDISTLI